jgi:hypothetical protein
LNLKYDVGAISRRPNGYALATTVEPLRDRNWRELIMGIEDFVEKAAGAYAAVKALETADPEAGGLAKAVAAVVGFEGVGAIKDHLAQQSEPQAAHVQADDAAAPPADDSQNG